MTQQRQQEAQHSTHMCAMHASVADSKACNYNAEQAQCGVKRASSLSIG
jgi:hypothetical protein